MVHQTGVDFQLQTGLQTGFQTGVDFRVDFAWICYTLSSNVLRLKNSREIHAEIHKKFISIFTGVRGFFRGVDFHDDDVHTPNRSYEKFKIKEITKQKQQIHAVFTLQPVLDNTLSRIRFKDMPSSRWRCHARAAASGCNPRLWMETVTKTIASDMCCNICRNVEKKAHGWLEHSCRGTLISPTWRYQCRVLSTSHVSKPRKTEQKQRDEHSCYTQQKYFAHIHKRT